MPAFGNNALELHARDYNSSGKWAVELSARVSVSELD